MNRRSFLALGALPLLAQRPTTAPTPGAPLPPPPAAKITSSVMLWPLKRPFEDAVLIAAKAGMQSVELLNEYEHWDDAALLKAKKFVNSFNMGIDAIVALPDLDKSINAARKLNCPQIILRRPPDALKSAADLAQKANLTLLIDSLALVKEADTPHVRLAFNISTANGNVVDLVTKAVDYTSVFHVGAVTGNIPYKEIFQALQKSGYSRYVAWEYAPEGDPVASLIKTVDGFRAALLERPAVASS